MTRRHMPFFTKALMAAFIFFISFIQAYGATFNVSSSGGSFNSGGAWSSSACGSAGVSWPIASTDVVNINCAGKTITAGASIQTCGALSITAGTLTISSGSTVYCTSLSMTGGTLTVDGTLNITTGGTGAFSISGGTFTPGTGTVILTAGAQALSSNQSFYNLSISGAGDKTMGTDITVAHQLTLTAANIIVGAHTLTVGSSSGGVDISQLNGHITTSSTSSLSFGGSIVQTLGDILSNSWPVTLNNFSMTRNLATITLGSSQSLTVNGTFNLSSGGNFDIGPNTLTLNGPVTMSGTCFCNQVTGGASSDIVIGNSPGGAASLYFDQSNTNPGGSNTIRNLTNNRTINSVVMLSNLRIGGTLAQASASSTVTIAAATSSQFLTIDGAISGSGGFIGNATYANLYIYGSGALSSGTLNFFTTTSLNNLTMNRSTNGNATLGTALTVNTLTLSQGLLILGSNDLVVTTNLTGSSGSNTNMVVTSASSGLLKRTITNAANGFYTFPIGTSDGTYNVYSGFVFNSLLNSTSRILGFKAVEADAPNLGTPTNYISRYWSSSLSDASGTYSYSMTLPYSASLPDDRHGDESLMAAAYYTSAWYAAGTDNAIAHTLVITNVTETSAPLGNNFTGTDGSIPVSVGNVISNKGQITVYPNPVNNQLVVSGLHGNDDAIINIYNILGEKVYNNEASSLKLKGDVFIDVPFLAQGVYFIQVKTAVGSETRKFIKQ